MSIKEEVLTLNPLEKIQLIDELLLSLDTPTKEINEIWLKEIEERIQAHENAQIESIPASEVFEKYLRY